MSLIELSLILELSVVGLGKLLFILFDTLKLNFISFKFWFFASKFFLMVSGVGNLTLLLFRKIGKLFIEFIKFIWEIEFGWLLTLFNVNLNKGWIKLD